MNHSTGFMFKMVIFLQLWRPLVRAKDKNTPYMVVRSLKRLHLSLGPPRTVPD